MRNLILLLLTFSITMPIAYGQSGINASAKLPSFGSAKIAFVNTQLIMEKVPSYRTAQSYLDKLAGGWEKEINAVKRDYEAMLRELEVDKILLSQELIQRRRTIITQKIEEYNTLKEKYFGVNGEYKKKQETLMRPILNDMNRAINDLAKSAKYILIQDVSEPGIIYANPKYDISDRVLKKMGYQ